ncbi:TAT leader-containing periplasmic protein [Shewanella decolorationis]|uniref:TAT leader-containing periplasmic protein n=1 Tax=Shewanella decolorationis TaxID=256839 RepID=A0A5B8R0P2_9GAMM|nr:TAT leader-containing periplasmic protein [Shewanella decolorationis]QDZ92274.1 TAT leader-containing periplasmic protein [Shewanella decolorationis]
MNRRTFLLGAFAGTAAIALGVNLYSPEFSLPDEGEDKDYRLLFGVLLPVMLDGALPDVASHKQAAQNRTLDAIKQSIDVLPDEQQAELFELLDMLENRLGLLLLTSSMTPLLMRSPGELTQMLETWRHSYFSLLQTAYLGLRELVMASYYACPEHWSRLHYAKPELFK